MKTNREIEGEAKSHVFLATHSKKHIKKERDAILRRFFRGGSRPYSKEELDERYFLIRALEDRQDLRSGFDISPSDDGSLIITETYRTTKRRLL